MNDAPEICKKETQLHGFSWEKDILTNVYGSTAEELRAISYTSKFDLPAELNRLDGCNLSVKTTGRLNMICMADCLRIFDAVDNDIPFNLVVIHYKQDDERKVKIIQNIVEIELTSSRELLFGTVSREQLEEFVSAVKMIPQKRKPTKEEHAKIYEWRDSIQSCMGVIHLDIKCNSEQSRVQCSLNRFQEFMQKYPERIIAQSTTNEFRGGRISNEIASSRRVFKKNKKTTIISDSASGLAPDSVGI